MKIKIIRWLENCLEECNKHIVENVKDNLNQAVKNVYWLTVHLICKDLLKLIKN